MKFFFSLSFLILLSFQLAAQEVVAHWSFDQIENSSVIELRTGKKDQIKGFFDPTAGVINGGIQFDGFTGYLERNKFGQDLPEDFTINVWLF